MYIFIYQKLESLYQNFDSSLSILCTNDKQSRSKPAWYAERRVTLKQLIDDDPQTNKKKLKPKTWIVEINVNKSHSVKHQLTVLILSMEGSPQ